MSNNINKCVMYKHTFHIQKAVHQHEECLIHIMKVKVSILTITVRKLHTCGKLVYNGIPQNLNISSTTDRFPINTSIY